MLMYLKSSISISLIEGCNLGCKYCILSSLDNHNQITVSKTGVGKLVFDLLNYQYYSTTVPITVNNLSEPFSSNIVFDNTLEILEALNEINIPNPIMVITKGYLSNHQINKLLQLDLDNLFIFYSYSGLAGTLEAVEEEKQIETIRKLSELNNLHLVHYWRPIIEGINSDETAVNKISKISKEYFEATVISGLRMNSYIKNVFHENQIPITIDYNPEHKVISKTTEDFIKSKLISLDASHPIFTKTSCAISYFMKSIDYNGYAYKSKFCNSECVNYNVCEGQKRIPQDDEIQFLLEKIHHSASFYVNDGCIFLCGAFSQVEITYLRHQLKYPVNAEMVIRSNNEDILSR